MILLASLTVLVPLILLALAAKLADIAGEAEWSAVQQAWDAELHHRYLAQYKRLR